MVEVKAAQKKTLDMLIAAGTKCMEDAEMMILRGSQFNKMSQELVDKAKQFKATVQSTNAQLELIVANNDVTDFKDSVNEATEAQKKMNAMSQTLKHTIVGLEAIA